MERTEQYIDSLLNTIRTSLPNFAKQTLSDALKDQAADAQAIIAALQSEVKDLKEWLAAYKQSLELAQSSLTQRTAERDTARRRVDELEAREVDVVLLRDDLEQRTAELEAANKHWDALWNAACEQKDTLQAELERVRGERDKLQSEVDGWELGSRVFP